mgnify:CR=1 FL=1
MFAFFSSALIHDHLEKKISIGDLPDIFLNFMLDVEIIDKGKEDDKASKAYDILSVIMILLSVSFILVETFPISASLHQFLYVFEVIIAVFFAVEYILRVWTAPMEFSGLRPDKARMRYIFSF